MTKPRARSQSRGAGAARRSRAQIPKALAAAIKRRWPRGVVEEFSTDESYFHDIRYEIEGDLCTIPGASLISQTEETAAAAGWDDDEEGEPLPPYSEWQSYHVYFLSPSGDEFRFEDETIGEDLDNDNQTTYPGEGRFGLALTISLAAPFAIINVSSYSWFEDGSTAFPDPISSFFWDNETGEALSADEYYRDLLSQEVFRKLEVLRKKLVSVMASHRISVLDESLLDLPVKGLRPDSEVFLTKPLCVRDAFFFRGV
jgi:hypothetical protein